MGQFTPNKYAVRLTADQRERLDALTRVGRAPVGKVRAARVPLLADHGRADGGWTDPAIADALGMHVNSVGKVRKRFVLEGEEPAVTRKRRLTPPTPPKMDGHLEAHLVALCCSPAPGGRARWTLELLAGELVNRKLVTAISLETVRQGLKKTRYSRGGSRRGASPNGSRRGS